jgi:hypothetical protein
LRTIPPTLALKLHQFGINKKRKRGRRGGKKNETNRGINYENVITIQCDKSDRRLEKNTEVSWNVFTINSQSLKSNNKDYMLRHEVDVNKLDFGLITETWLNNDEHWTQTCELNTEVST